MSQRFKITTIREEDEAHLINTANGGLNSYGTVIDECNDHPMEAKETEALSELHDRNMYLYSEEITDRPTVSTLLSKMANYNYLPPTQGDGTEDGTETKAQPKANLGTLTGVYLPCIQNIFGVILFIRMVWIVGTAGVPLAFVIVFICCSVTFCTSISLSAIATNGIVPAGGSYFMISRSLGPEFGGAVGVLFFLATAIAGAMYITGAVEIILNYISSDIALFGDFRSNKDILYHNIRIYGTILLALSTIIVFIGVKFVSKVAPVALVCVILSILSIYVGVFINYEGTDDEFCLLGNRIMSSKGYMHCTKNESDPLSLHHVFCEKRKGVHETPIRVGQPGKMIHPAFDSKWTCDPYYYNNNARMEKAVPGIYSGILSQNIKPRFYEKDDIITLDDDPTYEKHLKPYTNVFIDITTSFTFFVAIYFPSCTGILAGSNRSGDLKDGQKSIPIGTIAAQLTTSFVYLSSVVLFGATFNNLFIRDKFGECKGGQLAVTMIAWPYPFLIVVGSLLSTMGAALQSLTSAPRLIQAISKDGIIPFLNPFSTIDSRGEPVRALGLTLVIAWAAILIGNLDFIAPILTMFFLMCYMFVNLACTLQSLLRTPNWRPRFKYYHWTLSLTGVFLCLFVMFISSWYYALTAMIIAGLIYKYIEYRGAEKEWGDGFRGLALSAARYSLLRLEEGPPHTKNWRPQIILFAKVEPNTLDIKHKKLFAFASQLKAGKGLTLVCTCIHGEFDAVTYSQQQAAKQSISRVMNQERVKGFSNVLVTNNIKDGMSYFIQAAGLGGLKHNCVVVGWPQRWRQSKHSTAKVDVFLHTIKTVISSKLALLIPKGIDYWPDSGDKLGGCIDVWWIVHDGGLLMLLPFLLKQHKTWKNCPLRIFTVAQMEDNSIQMKKDLKAWVYALRIEAEVEVIEIADNDISAYTYERTLRMEQRTEMLKQMQMQAEAAGKTGEKSVRFARRKSSTPSVNLSDLQAPETISPPPSFTVQEATPEPSPEKKKKTVTESVPPSNVVAKCEDVPNPPPFNTSKLLSLKPDESNVRRMNTAVKLNEAIVAKSHSSKLVILNLPGIPKSLSAQWSQHYMEFLEVLTEGLERVIMVRGGGREVITIYS